VLIAVMGAEPTWAKMVTVVDEDVDIYNMDDVMWAILTRYRPYKDLITIPDAPTFYRDPQKDHWGRMGIDATAPFARHDEFVRKRTSGAATVDLSQYMEPRK
jgi:UbiD family decarboxylase